MCSLGPPLWSKLKCFLLDIGQILNKSGTDIHGPQRMKLNNCGDPFALVPQGGLCFLASS